MSQPIPTDIPRPKTIENPLVTELRLRLEEALATTQELRTANALLSDQNADLQKENRGLRQDAADARHDADQCLKELNRREDSGPPPGWRDY